MGWKTPLLAALVALQSLGPSGGHAISLTPQHNHPAFQVLPVAQEGDLTLMERLLYGGDRCDTIVPFILPMSEYDDPRVVKIYKPRELRRSPGNLTCSGEALLSDTSREPIFFKRFRDEDGEIMFQSSGYDDMD